MFKPFTIGNLRIETPTVMAPMCGISDSPWRRLTRRFGAGLVFTEMVSSEALTRERDRSYELLAFEAEEAPLAMQFCGANPEVLAEAAKKAEGLGAAMVDLNMGCPVKKIVNQGAGSALLLDLPLVTRILQAMVGAVKIPITLKIRAGWDEKRQVAHDVAKIAEDCGIAALSLHARTRSQGFSGKADWRIIRDLVQVTKLPVIGNGDVDSPETARAMMKETGCAGVMIGRGAQGRPWIFREIMDEGFVPDIFVRRDIMREHLSMALAFYGEDRGVRLMRKHLAWYSKGIVGGNQFRDAIMRHAKAEDVFREIDTFFTEDRVLVSEVSSGLSPEQESCE